MQRRKGLGWLVGMGGLVFAGLAVAAEYNGPLAKGVAEPVPPVQRIIVRWREASAASQRKPEAVAQAASRLGQTAGLRLKPLREVVPGMELLELERPLRGAELENALRMLRADRGVVYVEPDVWRRPHAVPSDALFPNQWFLQAAQASATRASAAWDTTQGSRGTVVAVLDTGVRFNHPDLGRATSGGKLLPGYDFVAADPGGGFAAANDGNGRDADPSDPGDWIDSGDLGNPAFSSRNCGVSASSWHGTRVSGLIGAMTDNGTGVAGLSWNAWVLPVRVLGKCGGFDSDILPAMRWAAGLPVTGVPDNPYPANIINLSLGADGPCQQTYVDLVSELAERGVLVVASAGNDGGVVDAPGNCPGVVGVGAIRHIGSKVGFSNLGPGVMLSAPGGNCVNLSPPCLFSIDTTTDSGETAPAGPTYTDQFNFNVGTSFSSPIVAGAAALMHAVNARLTPAHLAARLRESARPFPTTSPTTQTVCHVPASEADFQTLECLCTTDTCGAGMLDAQAAVLAAARPAIAIELPALVVGGGPVELDASGSSAACNRTIASFSWSEVTSTGAAITGADQPIATVSAPTSGTLTLELTVTDDQGAQDVATVTLTSNNATTTALPLLPGSACPTEIDVPQTPEPPAPPPPTPPRSGGGGGGGGFSALVLFAIAGALCLARMRRVLGARPRNPGD